MELEHVPLERNQGMLPVVVIHKDANERTVRHNRGHSIQGMSNMVFSMLERGWSDAEICHHLGMDPEELLRLKHITSFSALFTDRDYRRESRHQIRIRMEHQNAAE